MTPWITARQASLSITNSRSSRKSINLSLLLRIMGLGTSDFALRTCFLICQWWGLTTRSLRRGQSAPHLSPLCWALLDTELPAPRADSLLHLTARSILKLPSISSHSSWFCFSSLTIPSQSVPHFTSSACQGNLPWWPWAKKAFSTYPKQPALTTLF